MKTLLSLSLALFCLLFSSNTQAQVSTSFGPEIGFTASGLYDKYNEEVTAGLHIHAGATAHIQIGDFFAVRPSLLFQTGKFENPDYPDQTTKLTRISIPVAILFSKNFENENKMYFGAGPNFKYSIAGKTNNNFESEMRKIKFGTANTDDMKPFDLGLHFRGGFDFSRGLSLGLFLNWGLSNLDPHGEPYKMNALDAFGFSLAWMFSSNNKY
jgi:hypothetical protein